MKLLTMIDEINNYIKDASNIFIMAHKDLDLDAINSSVGMAFYVEKYNKKSYIIIDDENFELGVKKVLNSIKKSVSIIKSEIVEKKIDRNSLLIIVDTNKIKLLQNGEIVKYFDKIINIDHHDTNNESIKANLSVIDSSSSSTCEILSYFIKENQVKITSNIASLFLAGIVLDTNHYQLKTSYYTFYISGYLIECGADINYVNELLKQDIDCYVKRQKIITSVQIVDGIAFAKGTPRNIYKKEELAKSADSLLTFSKIKASFVVGKIDKNMVGVSARALDEIDVGNILEKFSGGGTQHEAACVIENKEIDDVLNELIKLIADGGKVHESNFFNGC